LNKKLCRDGIKKTKKDKKEKRPKKRKGGSDIKQWPCICGRGRKAWGQGGDLSGRAGGKNAPTTLEGKAAGELEWEEWMPGGRELEGVQKISGSNKEGTSNARRIECT